MTAILHGDFNYERIYRDSFFSMTNLNLFDYYYGIYFLLSGERKFFIDGKIYLLSGNDLLFIDKNVLHKSTYCTNTPHERILIKFTPAFIEELIKILGIKQFNFLFKTAHFHLEEPLLSKVLDLFQEMESEFHQKMSCSQLMLKSYLNQLIIHLSRSNNLSKKSPIALSKEESYIIWCINYIEQHYALDPSLNEIAQMLYLSPSYVSKLFKKVTGFNYSTYLTNIKLKHAKDLLITTEKSIAQISEECGFSNSNYFCDVFKKTNHQAPSIFRQQR